MAKGQHEPRYRAVIAQLVAAREAAGISQDELGRAMGYHQQYVSRFETGERRLDIVEIADLAALLGLDPGELIGTIPPRATQLRKG